MSDTITNRDFQRNIAKYLKTPGIYYLKGVKVTIDTSDKYCQTKPKVLPVRQEVSDTPSTRDINRQVKREEHKEKVKKKLPPGVGADADKFLNNSLDDKIYKMGHHSCGCKRVEDKSGIFLPLCMIHGRT